MSCGQRNGVIEKEERGPSSGSSKWVVEVPEHQATDDPQIPRVVAPDISGIIDQASSIASEVAAIRNGM